MRQTVTIELDDLMPEAVVAVRVAWECGDRHEPGQFYAETSYLVGLRIGDLLLEANQARAALGDEWAERLEQIAADQAVADAAGESARLAAEQAEAREDYGDWLRDMRTGG